MGSALFLIEEVKGLNYISEYESIINLKFLKMQLIKLAQNPELQL